MTLSYQIICEKEKRVYTLNKHEHPSIYFFFHFLEYIKHESKITFTAPYRPTSQLPLPQIY